MAAGGDREVEAARAALLTAMLAEAKDGGYAHASFERVAERAAVDLNEARRIFPAKEDCFLEAWDRVNAELMRRCAEAYLREGDWTSRLRAAAREFMGFVAEDQGRARVLIVDLIAAGPKGLARRDMNKRAFSKLIDAGRAEMEDPEAISHAVAEGIAGSIYGAVYPYLAADEPLPENLGDELLCMALMPYLGVERAIGELAA
jgi:AcrR family transcriptional regulator